MFQKIIKIYVTYTIIKKLAAFLLYPLHFEEHNINRNNSNYTICPLILYVELKWMRTWPLFMSIMEGNTIFVVRVVRVSFLENQENIQKIINSN